MFTEEDREKARETKAKRIAEGKPATRNPLEILKDKPNSRAASDKAICYQCQGGDIGDPPDEGWKWAVGNCTIRACANFNFRPYIHKLGQPAEGAYKLERVS